MKREKVTMCNFLPCQYNINHKVDAYIWWFSYDEIWELIIKDSHVVVTLLLKTL